MEILHCTADYDKVYYVEYNNTLCECKLLRTEAGCDSIPVYVLDIAGVGTIRYSANRTNEFDSWYNTSIIKGILYKSVEDFRNGLPTKDEYGSTGNMYNSKFIRPLLSKCTACNCGGGIYTWKWDGVKAVKYIVDASRCWWSWDSHGFHCNLNCNDDWYATKEECEKANSNNINVIRFKDYE